MILAIDPSANATGWAVLAGAVARNAPRVIDSGTFHPSGAAGAVDRLEQLARHVAHVVRSHNCTDAAVEVPDGGERYFVDAHGGRRRMGGSGVRTYAQAVGVCRAAAFVAGARVWPVGVTTWKGSEGKSVALLIARASLGREPRDTNEADAIGLGLHLICRVLPGCSSVWPPAVQVGPKPRRRGGFVSKSFRDAFEAAREAARR